MGGRIMAFKKPIPQAEWVFLFVEEPGQQGSSTEQRKEEGVDSG
jgi:hypothetical protein